MAGQTANMMSMIGFTMLLGLVTKNAILLIDYANQQREKGLIYAAQRWKPAHCACARY